MNNEEQKFQQFVDSVRFEDAPNEAHRDKLEKQVLETWDHEQKYGDYVEPVSLYVRKLAIAASFLVVCGLLFYGIESMFIGEQNYVAHHPEKEAIEQIIESEAATGAEKKQLVAQIKDVWNKISARDTDALVAVVEADETAYALRKWAAKYVGKYGGTETLNALESAIEQMDITNPDNPLMIAADAIRDRLGIDSTPEPEPQAVPDANTNGSFEAVPEAD
ncbi:MAG: hypothetical protein ACYSUT_04335 [Planctomycetota bacterium]|jgi:hypothetical protein